MKWIILLLISPSIFAQTTRNTLLLQDFSGGINTYHNARQIADNESQNLKNVLLDKNGSITKRQGITRLNSTAIGSGSTDVNAIYQLEASGGSKYCVGFTGSSGTFSTDGCQTFTVFVSTLTSGNDVNCDSMQDRLYCVNNQYNFYFNGTASSFLNSQAPANLKYIRVHRGRCFAAGASANLSRLYFSALADCTSWTTSTDFIDVSPQDGDVITGIGPPIYDMIPIYKKYSTWMLKGVDPNTFFLVNVSKEIGSNNHRSIQNLYLNGASGVYQMQLFDSVGPSGGQPGIYGFNGVAVREMSKKLRGSLDTADTFRAVTNRRTIDTLSDFQAGTFDSFQLSATRQNGVMQSSYTTITNNSQALFNAGTFINASASVPGSVYMSPQTSIWTNAGGESGDFTNWKLENSGTSGAGNGWANRTTGFTCQRLNADNATVSPLFGSYAFNSGNSSDGTNCNIPISESVLDGTSGVLLSSVSLQISNVLSGTTSKWQNTPIDTSNLNAATVKLQFSLTNSRGTDILTSSPIARGSNIPFRYNQCVSDQGACILLFDMDETIPKVTSGTFTSQCFDTSISTPIYGQFNVSITSSGDSGALFQTQTSTSCSGVFNTALSTNASGVITSADYRYIRYISSFTINNNTDTPASFSSVSFAAASTGAWTSPELFLSNNISNGGFGLFQTVQTTNGNATISYAIRGSTYSGGTKNSGYTTISPGNTIALTTGAYIQVISTFNVTAASETALTDVIVFNWNEGTAAKSSASGVYQSRYHYSLQSQNASMNDTIYILDSNGAWIKWDNLFARSLGVINQKFTMGGSSTTSGGFLYQLYNGQSDNGQTINAVYQTKDFDLGNIVDNKSVDELLFIGSNDNNTITFEFIGNTGITDNTYSIPLSTGMTYKIAQIPVEPAVNANVYSLKVQDNSILPWSVYGMGLHEINVGLEQP